jgi:putative chitinase
MNRKTFYDDIRPFFGQRILPKQFNGMEVILNEWDESELTDLRWLAYMLATVFHETAYTMQPIKEYGSNQYFINRYWKNEKIRKALGNLSEQDAVDFCGRGYVQITGRANYKKMTKILGVDLVGNPLLAMQTDIAVKIMFEGMTTGKSFVGDFTGKHLGNYFNKTTCDWVNARRIINGVDKANAIAKYAQTFYRSLRLAQ